MLAPDLFDIRCREHSDLLSPLKSFRRPSENGLLLLMLEVGGESGALGKKNQFNSYAGDALKLCFQQFFSYKCVS